MAFLNCHDATLFCEYVHLNQHDEGRLTALLDWLQEAGVMLLPRQADGCAAGLDQVLDHLRRTVGTTLIEAGMSSEAGRQPPGGGGPVAVMPVWPFEVEGDDPADRDVLLSSGRLWGADVLIEGLRVGGPDAGLPVKSVRSRFDRWIRAAGGGCRRVAIKPPSEDGWYVLSAISAPA